MQRYQIQSYHECKKSQKEIAEVIGVSKSTVSRELRRNKNKRGAYTAQKAHELACERKERFRRVRKFSEKRKKLVEKYLREEQWSPEQIKGYCEKHDIEMVSHERIYRHIREDRAKGGDLYKHTRHKLKHRKRPAEGKKVVIKDRLSIDERPEEVNNRERFGDWEMDLIVGKENKDKFQTSTASRVESLRNLNML